MTVFPVVNASANAAANSGRSSTSRLIDIAVVAFAAKLCAAGEVPA